MSFQWARNRIKNEHQYFHQCECEHVNPIMFISPLDFIGVCVYESQGWSHCILFQDFCWKYKFSRCILKSMKIDILKLIFFLKLNGILARWGILLKLINDIDIESLEYYLLCKDEKMIGFARGIPFAVYTQNLNL